LAGILAPELNEIGAAPGGVSVSADTSVGNLLSNVGSLLGSISRSASTGGPAATQSDRDDAALRPAFAQMQGLLQQRDSGELSPAAFTAKARALNKATTANYPHLRKVISEGFSVLAGEEVAPITPDVAASAAESALAFFNSDPEAKSRMGEAMRYSPDGSADNELTLTAMQALQSEIQGKRFRAADTKAKVEALRNAQAFTNAKQAENIDPLLNDMSLIAGQAVSSLTENFFNTGAAEASDAVSIINGLLQTKAEYLQIFTKQASENGILDEDRFRSGLTLVMAPFDRQIEALTAFAASPEQLANIAASENKKLIIETLNANGLFAGDEEKRLLGLNMFALARADLKKSLPDIRKLLMNSPTELATEGETTVIEDGTLTEPAVDAVSRLSQQERVDDIRGNIEGWETIVNVPDASLAIPENRQFLVQKFSLATGIIDTTGAPITEETFDKIYPPSIVKQYNRVVAFDDDIAMGMKETVKRNLSNIIDRRVNVVNALITNDFQTAFPSMSVKWNGSAFVLELSGATSTSAERKLVAALDTLKLPLTLEGIEELGKAVRREQIGVAPSGLDPKDVRTFESTTINIQLDSFTKLKDGIRFLNKVVKTASLFPEDVSTAVLPNEVGSTSGVVVVNSIEEVQKLSAGTEYRIKGMDHSAEPFVRGSERLPGGPE
jgi:hypothetical protein